MKRIILKKDGAFRIKKGHPWVWDNEIDRILDGPGNAEGICPSACPDAVLVPGEAADVESSNKEYLGRALVNPRSKIVARMYSRSKEGIDAGFFKRRIREALERRTAFYDLARDSCRAVFAEADRIPGLIIDRFVGWPFNNAETAPDNALDNALDNVALSRPLTFDDCEKTWGPPSVYLVVQFLTAAIEGFRDQLVAMLPEWGGAGNGTCTGIYEKSAVSVREAEGLPPREGLLYGTVPGAADNGATGLLIFENGFPFLLDIAGGQKTGHFLDQAQNRAALGQLVTRHWAAHGLPPSVLDCFSYTGGFSIAAARAGAAVTACDSSAAALSALQTNAVLNGVEGRITTVSSDVFDLLSQLSREKARFNTVILDPPAFAKTHTSKSAALRGYRELNLKAISLIAPAGFLVTCSCSAAVDEWLFRKTVAEAALDAGRRLEALAFRHQSPDHPVLIGYDESLYLKCGIYRVL